MFVVVEIFKKEQIISGDFNLLNIDSFVEGCAYFQGHLSREINIWYFEVENHQTIYIVWFS